MKSFLAGALLKPAGTAYDTPLNSQSDGECSYPAEFTDSCLSMYTALFGQLEEGAGGESVMHGKN